MKYLLLTAIVLAIIYLFFPRSQTEETISELGGYEELRILIERLTASNNNVAFLVIRETNTKEFLQISGDETGSQIDFPLIEDNQIALEGLIKDVADRYDFDIEENLGSDGGRFLDINIKGNSNVTYEATIILLKEVFGASKSSKFEFTHWKLKPNL